MTRFRIATLAVADVVVLVFLTPVAAHTCRRLPDLRGWLLADGVDDVAAVLVGSVLWLAAARVAVGLLAMAASYLPGAVGSTAGRVAAVALPRLLQQVVIGSAGLGVLLAPLAPGAAAAGSPDASGGRPVVSQAGVPGPVWPMPLPAGPSWPGGDATAGPTPPPAPASPAPASPAPASPPQSLPSRAPASTPAPPSGTTSHTDAPSVAKNSPAPTGAGPAAHGSAGPGPHATSGPAPHGTPAPMDTPPAASGPARRVGHPEVPLAVTARVTVTRGDCLWLLAAQRLGAAATPTDVAAYVPRLYTANRAVIGDDPDLLRPGQRLSLPAVPATGTPQESP